MPQPRSRPGSGTRPLASRRRCRSSPRERAPMHDPKSIVRELVDAYNAKSVDRLVALYHPDGRLWSPFERDGIVGRAAIGESIRRLFEAYPDEEMTIELLAGDETHAIAEFRSVGLGPD